METVDEEFLDGALDFIERQHKAGKPFFCWWNSTRMHVCTHLKRRRRARPGSASIRTAWWSTTVTSGRLLDKLDELGIAEDTIVMYSTDNGAEVMTWPDGGTTPSAARRTRTGRAAGASRARPLARAHRARHRLQRGVLAQDMLPTLLAAAGEPDIVEKVKKGHRVGNKTFKVHIDGFNLLPFLEGEVDENPRPGFLYWSDDGEPDGDALRELEGPFHGAARSRAERMAGTVRPDAGPNILQPPQQPIRGRCEDANVFFNKEKADSSSHLAAVALVSEYLKTFEEFPPRQRPASFSIDQALEKAREREEQMHATATRAGAWMNRSQPGTTGWRRRRSSTSSRA